AGRLLLGGAAAPLSARGRTRRRPTCRRRRPRRRRARRRAGPDRRHPRLGGLPPQRGGGADPRSVGPAFTGAAAEGGLMPDRAASDLGTLSLTLNGRPDTAPAAPCAPLGHHLRGRLGCTG